MKAGKGTEGKGTDIWDDIFQEVKRLFLDTAPLIYFVEKHPTYAKHLRPVFDRIDKGKLSAFTSPITLAECLVQPCRLNLPDLQKASPTLSSAAKIPFLYPLIKRLRKRPPSLELPAICR
ncbi:MAG: type II toxin-antitoxin system VapC family toxin [bacterium]